MLDVIQKNRLDKTGDWDFTGANLTVSDPATALEVANRQWVLSQVGGGSLWDRTGTTLEPHNANDSINMGSGDITTTGDFIGDLTGNSDTVSNGVYTTGADTVFLTPATAAATYALALGADENYVTDAQLVVIGNTSGTNTGDNTVCTSGDATTAETLKTARNIGGVSFDGSVNIDLPGVNQSGNQDTSGQADTVTTNADLTGIVTSTGNATSIANKAISTAKLADGTDGELITWNAAGNISHVPVGTATHVLTSNGVGAAPTFQGGGGGGGLAGTSIKTIGTSGDYSDVAAAIAGESSPYHFVLVSNVTEDSDIPIDGVLVLDLDRYKLTMGAHQFTTTSLTTNYIKGSGIDSGAEIEYTATVNSKRLFDLAWASSTILDIKDFIFDNNSTSSHSGLTDGAIIRAKNIKVELPNTFGAGFYNYQDGSYLNNVELVGGGTSCYYTIDGTGGRICVNNISFTGTFHATENIATFPANSIVNNLVTDHSTNAGKIEIRGQANGVLNKSAQDLILYFGAHGVEVTNVNIAAGKIDPYWFDNAKISNIIVEALDLDQADASNHLISNARITNASTVAGDRHKFTNVEFLGGVSISSGANDNGLLNCQAGADAGGGANTITVVAGSNRTRIVGCMTDVAISDSGTGTVTSANTIY